jgi:hypothetical protein
MRKTLLLVCMGGAALVASASVLAAQAPRLELRPMAIEGTPFQEGDSLALLDNGQVQWQRDGRVVATLNDPEGLIRGSNDLEADRALYVTDGEGGVVHDYERVGATLFLSSEAPMYIFHQRGVILQHGAGPLPGVTPDHGASPLPGAPPQPGVTPQRGARPNAGSAGDMTWHGGTILVANKTMAIFWGSWGSPGDIITGLDRFFQGFGGSAYAGDSTEYTGSNGQVTSSSTYLGHVLDTSAPPSRSPSVSKMVAEACKVTNNNPDPNALYLIYTSNFPKQNSFCAWHSYGNCSNGAPVQVANMPNTTGISGCNPSDTWTTNSEGLASLANVTSHELSETITDPRNGGWYDANGQENGDKCAWSFNHVVTLANGALFKLQMEWSNNAFNAGTGFLNLNGQPGCLQ